MDNRLMSDCVCGACRGSVTFYESLDSLSVGEGFSTRQARSRDAHGRYKLVIPDPIESGEAPARSLWQVVKGIKPEVKYRYGCRACPRSYGSMQAYRTHYKNKHVARRVKKEKIN